MSSQIYWPFPPGEVGGWPGSYAGHVGTDWPKPIGTPVRACFDGVAVFVGGDGASGWMGNVKANGEGKTIDLRRSDGLIARYGHLNSYAIGQGQSVKAGDVIGYTGNTGYSTGPHLHWELRWDRAWSGGNWVDPRNMNVINFGGGSPSTNNGKDHDMAFESIRHPNGTTIFADEYGTEGIDAYRSSDIGGAEYLNAFYKGFPGSRQVNAREFDIIRAIANRRTAAVEDRIARKVAAKIAQPDTAQLTRIIEEAIKKQGVTVEVDSKAIAKAVNDDVSARMKG